MTVETINGEWYMKGCGREDPRRLRTLEEAARRIREVGFLPLFSNELPGFSIEEQTWAGDWWTDDPARDPWDWRQALSRMPGIVYGKFFEGRAGFVSAPCFPDFANLRRQGYDFDTLRDEGLASHRAQKLMAPFLTDGEANDAAFLSAVLKQEAGFGKGGEKNFEGVLTDLQMKTYLIIGDFRQRLNRRGAPYGWHLALIQTPEAKLGYEALSAAYARTPEESRARLLRQALTHFPQGDKAVLQKLIG